MAYSRAVRVLSGLILVLLGFSHGLFLSCLGYFMDYSRDVVFSHGIF